MTNVKCKYLDKCTRANTNACLSCKNNEIRDYYEPVYPYPYPHQYYYPYYWWTSTNSNSDSESGWVSVGSGDYFVK